MMVLLQVLESPIYPSAPVTDHVCQRDVMLGVFPKCSLEIKSDKAPMSWAYATSSTETEHSGGSSKIENIILNSTLPPLGYLDRHHLNDSHNC